MNPTPPTTNHQPPTTIKIGTRRSPLALAQAGQVAEALVSHWPEYAGKVKLVEFVTSGDRFLGQPLSEIGGKGLFTKEIEEALLDGQIDFAVHSLKDMPTVLPDGLMLGAVPMREDARDVLISNTSARNLMELPENSCLGTSSLRRMVQVKRLRPDIEIVPFRGNVQSRMRKLQAGEVDATLLALAGLKRLGFDPLPGSILSAEEMLPAVAQGALALECRQDDTATLKLLHALNHVPTQHAVTAERALLRELDGSCRTPIAAYARVQGSALHVRACMEPAPNTALIYDEITGELENAKMLGQSLGQRLKAASASLL